MYDYTQVRKEKKSVHRTAAQEAAHQAIVTAYDETLAPAFTPFVVEQCQPELAAWQLTNSELATNRAYWDTRQITYDS